MNKGEIEVHRNVTYPYLFRKSIPAGDSGVMKIKLTGHGYVTKVVITFSAGENGTLRLRPYVMIPGEITQELLRYAQGGNAYVSGDNATYQLPCYQEIETDAELCVHYENTATDEGTVDSEIMVDIIVQYDEYFEPKNIIG